MFPAGRQKRYIPLSHAILDVQQSGGLPEATLQMPRRNVLLACLVPPLCSALGLTPNGTGMASPPVVELPATGGQATWMSGPLVILQSGEKPAQTVLRYEG